MLVQVLSVTDKDPYREALVLLLECNSIVHGIVIASQAIVIGGLTQSDRPGCLRTLVRLALTCGGICETPA